MKTSFALVFLAFSFALGAQTKDCTLNYSKEGSTLGWTAFKTPKKVGVNAKFSDFTINAKPAHTADELLSTATFEVNSQAIDSGDKARDAKIAQFFFRKMLKGTKITGKVVKMSEGKAEVEMMMNGVKKNVEMISKYDEEKSTLTLTGAMDVLEFGMKDNLAALTKACFEKHEGVTWPNVNMELVASIKKICK